MSKIEINVENNIVRLKYRRKKKVKEYEWEDCQDLTRKLLARFDKINKCNKNINNCLFSRKSDSNLRPNEFALTRTGSESTTWRVVLVNLRALEWARAIKLRTAVKE